MIHAYEYKILPPPPPSSSQFSPHSLTPSPSSSQFSHPLPPPPHSLTPSPSSPFSHPSPLLPILSPPTYLPSLPLSISSPYLPPLRHEKYIGMWMDDRYNGPGVLITSQQTLYTCNFENGSMKSLVSGCVCCKLCQHKLPYYSTLHLITSSHHSPAIHSHPLFLLLPNVRMS